MKLAVSRVEKAFNGQPVLRDVSLEVQEGEIMCLLGPSGCGKTTLLRLIAGLEQVDAGDIQVDDTSIMNVPVHKRGFGFMFQDFALFPHMDVAQNITFGLKMHRASHIQNRLEEMIGLVGLTGMEKRDVTQLSGGERQRVALARSIAPQPGLLLLDEPLGSLDYALRERLVMELRTIIKQTGITSIYVTHDQQEAFAIADRIALMNIGTIEQIASPNMLYRQPVSEFAARFLGLDNIVPVLNQHGNRVETPLGVFTLSQPADCVLLHPLGIDFASEDRLSSITTEIIERRFQGSHYKIKVRHESGYELRFEVTSQKRHLPDTGEQVALYIAPEMIVALHNQQDYPAARN